MGRYLMKDFGIENEYEMNMNQVVRIYRYYLPVYFWILESLKDRKKSCKPLVLGISAPQGCGKTTLVTYLQSKFFFFFFDLQ